MPPESSTLPLLRIAVFAFVLNALWEFGQCTILYDMTDWSLLKLALVMWGAVAGDVAIVLGVTFGASKLAGSRHLNPIDVRGWVAVLVLGFIAAVFFEWAARALAMWSYSDSMPVAAIAGYTIGLSPIAQITLLPGLSVFLATVRRNKE